MSRYEGLDQNIPLRLARFPAVVYPCVGNREMTARPRRINGSNVDKSFELLSVEGAGAGAGAGTTMGPEPPQPPNPPRPPNPSRSRTNKASNNGLMPPPPPKPPPNPPPNPKPGNPNCLASRRLTLEWAKVWFIRVCNSEAFIDLSLLITASCGEPLVMFKAAMSCSGDIFVGSRREALAGGAGRVSPWTQMPITAKAESVT
ncbi:hypothetical protein RvY_07274 [Ramazzottius varieornatus]|uniref:Uncharacterized protein n=1 Tax=Ramazzottius varieornatus TaxID=947166 RepID=A0A1D1V1I4_RAMVA|nr:hypothetical protein RvY_07274 [Ramazzottius varieornatus]